jgi:hypothetical protein
MMNNEKRAVLTTAILMLLACFFFCAVTLWETVKAAAVGIDKIYQQMPGALYTAFPLAIIVAWVSIWYGTIKLEWLEKTLNNLQQRQQPEDDDVRDRHSEVAD